MIIFYFGFSSVKSCPLCEVVCQWSHKAWGGDGRATADYAHYNSLATPPATDQSVTQVFAVLSSYRFGPCVIRENPCTHALIMRVCRFLRTRHKGRAKTPTIINVTYSLSVISSQICTTDFISHGIFIYKENCKFTIICWFSTISFDVVQKHYSHTRRFVSRIIRKRFDSKIFL